MAFHVYAQLTMNGTALDGETSLESIGDAVVSSDHIEIYELNFGAERNVQSTGKAKVGIGKHVRLPVQFVKRTDQTTPLLYQGLRDNQEIEGEIKIFDADPESGDIRQRFAVTLTRARLTAVSTTSPDVFHPEDSNRPVYDYVEIVPHTITYVDVVNGVEFEDKGTKGAKKKASKSRKRS